MGAVCRVWFGSSRGHPRGWGEEEGGAGSSRQAAAAAGLVALPADCRSRKFVVEGMPSQQESVAEKLLSQVEPHSGMS